MKIKKILIVTLLIISTLICACNNKKDIDKKGFNYPNNKTYYQVFVRSFSDSNQDGIGDLIGLTNKLPYLKKLGVEGLWLMPIFKTNTYHGYDVVDYKSINPDYGTMKDFENLSKNAKKLGIDIMLDMIFNHTSEKNEWFLKALNGDKKYLNYYHMAPLSTTIAGSSGADGQNIWHTQGKYRYSGVFSNTMPDLNLSNEEVVKEIYDISDFWIDKGVDAFRLDACKYFFSLNEDLHYRNPNVDDNLWFIQNLNSHLKEKKKDFYLTGEIFDYSYIGVSPYYKGLDSPLDFPISNIIMEFANKVYGDGYITNINRCYQKYSTENKNFISAPFLTNHDMDRVATKFNNDKQKMKFAAEMLLTLPGNPIIYYGEELGMLGYKSNGPYYDETRRLPFKWGDFSETSWFTSNINNSVDSLDVQMNDSNSIYNVYKKLLDVRNKNIALKYGNNFKAYENNQNKLQGYYRSFTDDEKTQKVLVLHNFDQTATNIPIIEDSKIIYLSGTNSYDNATKIPAKGTVILEVKVN